MNKSLVRQFIMIVSIGLLSTDAFCNDEIEIGKFKLQADKISLTKASPRSSYMASGHASLTGSFALNCEIITISFESKNPLTIIGMKSCKAVVGGKTIADEGSIVFQHEHGKWIPYTDGKPAI